MRVAWPADTLQNLGTFTLVMLLCKVYVDFIFLWVECILINQKAFKLCLLLSLGNFKYDWFSYLLYVDWIFYSFCWKHFSWKFSPRLTEWISSVDVTNKNFLDFLMRIRLLPLKQKHIFTILKVKQALAFKVTISNNFKIHPVKARVEKAAQREPTVAQHWC